MPEEKAEKGFASGFSEGPSTRNARDVWERVFPDAPISDAQVEIFHGLNSSRGRDDRTGTREERTPTQHVADLQTALALTSDRGLAKRMDGLPFGVKPRIRLKVSRVINSETTVAAAVQPNSLLDGKFAQAAGKKTDPSGDDMASLAGAQNVPMYVWRPDPTASSKPASSPHGPTRTNGAVVKPSSAAFPRAQRA